MPTRMIQAYQTTSGAWLAGMTLKPDSVSEAWCHQRGYVCFIQEIGGVPVKIGEPFGAAYVIGWFDDVAEMEAVYDAHKGARRLEVSKAGYQLVK